MASPRKPRSRWRTRGSWASSTRATATSRNRWSGKRQRRRFLRAIAASPGDAEGTLKKIAETTAHLFGATGVSFRIAEGDEFKLFIGVGRGAQEVTRKIYDDPARRLKVSDPGLPGRVITGNRQIHVPDLDHLEPEMASWPGLPIARAAGTRTMVGTPLRSGGRAVGAVLIYRDELRPFDDVELQLVQSFADQAVIAIENARLLSELRQSLDRQTATAEVLQVINSSPGDVAPVFDAILEKAHTLCGAARGSLFLIEGDSFHAAATRGYPDDMAAGLRRSKSLAQAPPFRALIAGRRMVHQPDLLTAVAEDDLVGREVASAAAFAPISCCRYARTRRCWASFPATASKSVRSPTRRSNFSKVSRRKP